MLSMLFLITSFLAVGDLVNYATKPHVIPEASLRVYGVSVVSIVFCLRSVRLLFSNLKICNVA
jgi:hypothetical protein